MEKCNSETLLKKNNIKITEKRKEVLDLILKLAKPFSASTIHESLAHKTKVDSATIYRNINLFENKKIITRICSIGGKAYYEHFCPSRPNHLHFICEECSQIFCIAQPADKNRYKELLPEGHFKVNSCNISFLGKCDKCIYKEEK